MNQHQRLSSPQQAFSAFAQPSPSRLGPAKERTSNRKQKEELIERTFSTNTRSASASMKEVFKKGDHSFMLVVKSNSYDFQREAHISVWRQETLSWNSVYSIPGPDMATSTSLYLESRKAEAKDVNSFKVDADRLKKNAFAILNIK